MDLSLLGQSRDAERQRPAAHPVLAPGSPTPRERGPTRRSTQLNTLLWLPQSGPSVDGHFLSLRRSQTLPCPGLKKILILLRFLVGFRHSSTNFHALQSRKSPLSFPRIWRANATAPPSETVRARISTDLRLVKFTTSTVLRSTANSYAPVPAHGPPNNTAPAYSSPSINV